MRFVKHLILFAIFASLFFAYAKWSEKKFKEYVTPPGMVLVNDYFLQFGEPRSITAIELKSTTHCVITWKTPPAIGLVLPSGPPGYLFDASGHLVDCCYDLGEISSPWPKGVEGVNGKVVAVENFKREFGINAGSK